MKFFNLFYLKYFSKSPFSKSLLKSIGPIKSSNRIIFKPELFPPYYIKIFVLKIENRKFGRALVSASFRDYFCTEQIDWRGQKKGRP